MNYMIKNGERHCLKVKRPCDFSANATAHPEPEPPAQQHLRQR